ncbi:hypothetical protein GOODEAATRI_029766, partial [Goodea atripinnis]
VAELCPEHEEKLKLFCITDQRLACIICRDGEEHEGHRFKPAEEVGASFRKQLDAFELYATDDIHAIESLANRPKDEMLKTRVRSQQLMTQVSKQFQEMHQFLRRRENEIKSELKLKEEPVFRPRVNKLQVVNSSLSLGPYESHLQFFVWKEMLQVIQRRAELLTLKSNSPDVVVSDDGRSLFCRPKTKSAQTSLFQQPLGIAFGGSFTSGHPVKHKFSFDQATVDLQTAWSISEFGAGHYYWEVEVGSRDYWELGIIHNFLKYDWVQYATCDPNVTTEVQFENRPRKIGVYFNCSSKDLSFYDADTMTHIHSVSAVFVSKPVSAQIKIKYREPDNSPVTVCWY